MTQRSRAITRAQLLRRAAAALAAGALAACGEVGTAPAASKARPVTVTYLSNLPETHPEGAGRLGLLDEFNKTNTLQITVDVSDAKATSGNDKLKTLAAAGTPPDLVYNAYYFVAEFFLAGMTIDVDTELKTEKDWAKQRADIFPPMLESSLWAGKMAGMPGYTNNQAMIYNTGLLQQAGVAPPKQGWTWDDFRAMAQKFVRPGVISLSMAWAGTWRHWLGTTGARIITKDNRKITADTPEMLQVMELYLDLLKRGIMLARPDGRAGLNETYRLAKNDTVFELQGPYRIPTLRQEKVPDFLTIHTPVHPVKKQLMAANGGHSMMIFKEVPPARRHAAALVAKWMNAPHAQAQFCIRATSIPVSRAAMESRELQDYLKTDPPFKGFVDLAPNGWRWPALPSYDKINSAADKTVEAIMRQEIGVKAGLAKMQQETQVLLDEDVRLMG